MQVAKLHGIMALIQAPYYLIGQEFAAAEASERIIHHIAIGEERLLVMVFAGPSGHGKTELALDMKVLLSVKHIVVDRTEVRHETNLFGPKAPYHGYEKGSPLNNHLCRESGRRNIVFPDEFEQSTRELWAALLSVVEGGKFHD
jgi:ATP-dependent Clp protease ATP-binding subunit ClpA